MQTLEDKTAYQRLRRQRNKELFGVCEPERVYHARTGEYLPRRLVDPDDYGHPESDVRVGP